MSLLGNSGALPVTVVEGVIGQPLQLCLARADWTTSRPLRMSISADLLRFAPWIGVTSLSPLSHVVSLGAQMQVSRIAARRVVTVVKHTQAFWDWAIRQFPDQSVRHDETPWRTAHTNNAVAKRGAALRLPFPALIRSSLADISPQALFESLSHTGKDNA